MNRAQLVKQLVVSTDNKMGKFAEVTDTIAQANVNLKALCAWGEPDKAVFAMLTDNNAKATRALALKGWKTEEKSAVCVTLADCIGAAADVAKVIKAAGIDLDYVYGTSCGCAETSALLVLVSKDNEKLLEALNG